MHHLHSRYEKYPALPFFLVAVKLLLVREDVLGLEMRFGHVLKEMFRLEKCPVTPVVVLVVAHKKTLGCDTHW